MKSHTCPHCGITSISAFTGPFGVCCQNDECPAKWWNRIPKTPVDMVIAEIVRSPVK